MSCILYTEYSIMFSPYFAYLVCTSFTCGSEKFAISELLVCVNKSSLAKIKYGRETVSYAGKKLLCTLTEPVSYHPLRKGT